MPVSGCPQTPGPGLMESACCVYTAWSVSETPSTRAMGSESANCPLVGVVVAIFAVHERTLRLLLVRRMRGQHHQRWVLPGGRVRLDENLEDCARRELAEQAGICGVYLEQLYTFGRVSADPRGRVVNIAYYAAMPPDRVMLRQSAGAGEAEWFGFDALPILEFDHQEIVTAARRRLAAKLNYSTVAFQLVPEMFTLGELQEVYEIIQGADLDKRNFRRRVLALGAIEETCEKRNDGRSRPARLYRARQPGSVAIVR